MNTLQKLLEKYPNKEWCFKELSSNPCITVEYVYKHPEINWSWYFFSSNPNVTPEYIESDKLKPWNWGCYGISSNTSITPDFITANIKRLWYWGEFGLSSNPSITVEFVIENINRSWDWRVLSSNPAITLEFVITNIEFPWDFARLSSNPIITEEFVYTNIGFFWNVRNLLINPSITLEFINEHFINNSPVTENNWEWENSGNISITPEFITERIERQWKWGSCFFSGSPFCSINEPDDKFWDYWDSKRKAEGGSLSSNPAITMEFIEQNIDRQWTWGQNGISSNIFELHPFIKQKKTQRERTTLLLCKDKFKVKNDYVPMDVIRYITEFI
jgi:hypothetical protein